MDLSSVAKWAILCGLGVAAFGLVLWLVSKSGLPFGNLPGDIRIERPGFSFGFPVVTCIVLSVVVTLVLNIVLWFFRR